MGVMVLLHGFAGGSRSWGRVVRSLRVLRGRETLVMALALPGHAGGEAVDGMDDFDDVVAQVGRSVEGLSEGPHRVVGYSLGGRIALGLTLSRPDLVSELVLIGAHPGLSDPEARRQRAAGDAAWAALLRCGGVAAFADAWSKQSVFDGQAQRADAAALAEQDEIRLGHDAQALARAMELVSLGKMPDFSARLPDLRMPVRLLVGELDLRFIDVARAMLPRLAHGSLTLAPGCGHNIALEAPDWLAAELSREPK